MFDEMKAFFQEKSIYIDIYIQYSPKIMHAQEVLFASARSQLLAAFCRSVSLGSCKVQEVLCG